MFDILLVLDITKLRLLYLVFIWRGRGVCSSVQILSMVAYAEFLFPDSVCSVEVEDEDHFVLQLRSALQTVYSLARESLQQAVEVQNFWWTHLHQVLISPSLSKMLF